MPKMSYAGPSPAILLQFTLILSDAAGNHQKIQ